jgi:hypothetical protein
MGIPLQQVPLTGSNTTYIEQNRNGRLAEPAALAILGDLLAWAAGEAR